MIFRVTRDLNPLEWEQVWVGCLPLNICHYIQEYIGKLGGEMLPKPYTAPELSAAIARLLPESSAGLLEH